MNHLEVLAIIPARGGSKGVPRKNVKPLAGLPLVAWSIRQSLACPLVCRTVVSTDDDEIADTSRRHGAEVIRRPAALATDEAPTEPALLHVLQHLEQAEGYRPDLVVLLQPTSPNRGPDLIGRCIAALRDQNRDSLLTVVPTDRFFWREGQEGALALYDYRHRPRRQDIRPEDRLWMENGSVYVTRREVLLSSGNRLGGVVGTVACDAFEALEIDTPEDWEQCRQAMLAKGFGRSLLPSPVDCLVLDFDGVLTDNRVWTDSQGNELVTCTRADGIGADLLRQAGIPVAILSTETNPVVKARADKLKLPCIQGVRDKGEALRTFMDQQGLRPGNVVYVGNDVNDLPAFAQAGCTVAVADAHPVLRQKADVILDVAGGCGVLRHLADLLQTNP